MLSRSVLRGPYGEPGSQVRVPDSARPSVLTFVYLPWNSERHFLYNNLGHILSLLQTMSLLFPYIYYITISLYILYNYSPIYTIKKETATIQLMNCRCGSSPGTPISFHVISFFYRGSPRGARPKALKGSRATWLVLGSIILKPWHVHFAASSKGVFRCHGSIFLPQLSICNGCVVKGNNNISLTLWQQVSQTYVRVPFSKEILYLLSLIQHDSW